MTWKKESSGRGRGINLVGQGFEMHAALLQVADDRHQVFHAASQPVKFPHDQAITLPHCLERELQAFPRRLRTAGLVLVDFVAPGLVKRVILQAQVLVLGGYLGITDVQGLPLS